MKVDITTEGGVIVARAAGTFDDVASDGIVAAARESGGSPRLVVDLSGMESLASSGLAGLVRMSVEVGEMGGRMAISSPARGLRQVLELTNTLPLFTVTGDVESAKKAVAGS